MDFLIKFMALASKAQTDNQHAIFLLKKNVNRKIIRAIMAYLLQIVTYLFVIGTLES